MRKRYDELDDEDLARICHEAHVALRIGLNDSATDVHWDALPQDRKNLVINEVRLIREGKRVEEIHQAWVDWMTEREWKWDTYRNTELKMHPNLVPYEDLPPEEKAKVRQAVRIVFTHVLPDPLEEIAYSDIRSRPVEPGVFVKEELPGDAAEVAERILDATKTELPAAEQAALADQLRDCRAAENLPDYF